MTNLRKPLVIAGMVFVLACSGVALMNLNAEGVERQRSRNMLNQVVRKLHTGMSREDVLPVVQTAWRHYDCRNRGIDVYLFGSHNPELAAILVLRYSSETNKQTLIQIATYENYLLSDFSDCRIEES